MADVDGIARRRDDELAEDGRAAKDTRTAAGEPRTAVLGQRVVSQPRADRTRHLEWAQLLRRVFAIDVLRRPRCCGTMHLICPILDDKITRHILQARSLLR